MKVTICIGSSCHLKGSQQVIETLQRLVREQDLESRVELCGAFCMGNCTNGVSVKVDEELYSLQAGNVEAFFRDEVLKRI